MADREVGYKENNAPAKQKLEKHINSKDISDKEKSALLGFSAHRQFAQCTNPENYIDQAKKALKLNPDNWRAATVMAFDAFYNGDFQDYEKHLEQALKLVPNSPKLLSALLDLSLAQNRPDLIKEYLNSALLNSDSYIISDLSKKLELFLSDIPHELNNDNKHLVMISGVSHCGSTYLGHFFSAHDDVECLGESHRISMYASEARGKKTRKSNAKFIPCHTCGDTECEQYPDDFREILRNNSDHYYHKIARRSSAKVVAFGDKNFSITRNLDPKANFSEIILFKKPENAYRSQYKHKKISPIEDSNLKSVDQYLRIYTNSYSSLMLPHTSMHQRIFLNWESFTADPKAHIPKIAEVLQTTLDENILGNFGLTGHSFGGNGDVNKDHKNKNSEIKKTPSTILPDDLLLEAQRNQYAEIVYQRMMKLYRRDFNTV